MKECILCKILKGEISSHKVWEDKEFFAFMDINPVNPGHVLLVPKKHVDYIFNLPDGEYKKIFEHAKFISSAIQRATKAKRIGMAIEGLSVPHAHIHLIPVNNPNDLDPCRARKAEHNELQQMAEKIIAQIEKTGA